MVESKLLKTRALKNGDTVELHQLSADWQPWTHQVNRLVHSPERVAFYDPQFAKDAKPCRTGSINFENLEDAEASFLKQ